MMQFRLLCEPVYSVRILVINLFITDPFAVPRQFTNFETWPSLIPFSRPATLTTAALIAAGPPTLGHMSIVFLVLQIHAVLTAATMMRQIRTVCRSFYYVRTSANIDPCQYE